MDSIIQSFSSGLTTLSTTLVHPTYFPYLLGPSLHAARISLVYQSLTRRSTQGKLSWGTYIAGYLITCWAGGFLTNFLLGLPPPMIYTFHPYINYIGVHLALTLLINLFPFLLVPKILDTVLFPLDALLRVLAVTNTLALLNHPLLPASHRPLSNPLGHLILGALASASGGIALTTFSLFSPEWKFTTPPVLKAGLWSSADVWGGALAALVFSSVTQHSSFSLPELGAGSLTSDHFPLNLIPSSLLTLLFKASPHSLDKPTSFHLLSSSPMSPQSAKALASLSLTVVFGARVLFVHWLPKSGVAAANNDLKSTKGGKRQTQ